MGAAVTVTVRVALALAHPPVPVTTYVIVAVPDATPLTDPVDALIVAIKELEDDQVPPAEVELKRTEPETQIACVPLSVPALGGAVTVTIRVAEALAQPPVPATV